MTDIAPPAYNASPPGDRRIEESERPPPNYTVPTSFTIGSSRTLEPLVKIPEIKGHLALLHAFQELRNHVDEADGHVAPNVTLEKERKWGWFVGVAVERCVEPYCYDLR